MIFSNFIVSQFFRRFAFAVCLFFAFLGFFVPSLAENTKNLSGNFDTTQTFSFTQSEKNIEISDGFTAIGVQNAPANAEIFIKTNVQNDWQKMELEEEGNVMTSDLMFLENKTPATQFSFRLEQKNPENLNREEEKISFYFLNEKKLAEKSLLASADGQNFSNSYVRDWNFFQTMGIVSRENWGADESWRMSDREMPEESVSGSTAKGQECVKKMNLYPEDFASSKTVYKDGENFLAWPYKYSPKIKKIVVHHTAEDGFKDGRSPESVMRAIYSYHARSRGWGDIGYNFIISPDGQIFEGRAGGDFVVGGHVFCANTQTVGVSLMGNFENDSVPEVQMAALEKLLGGLSQKYSIDVSEESSFQGKFTANLVGHRDYGATACPGKNMYSLLPLLRNQLGFVSGTLGAGSRSAQFVGNVSLLSLPAEGKKEFVFSYKNTGTTTWKSGTWLYADLPKTDVSVLSADSKNDFFAARLNEKEVLPNGIGTFTVQVLAGIQGGLHTIEFTPVVDSRRVSGASVVLPIETKNGKISARVVASAFTKTGDGSVEVEVLLQNAGNVAWQKENFALEIKMEREKNSIYMRENTVMKGEFAHFSGKIPLPQTKKKSINIFAYLTKDDKKISGVKQIKVKMPLSQNSGDSVSASGSAFSGKVEGSNGNILNSAFSAGVVPEKYFHIQNLGSVPWKNGEVFLRVKGEGIDEKISAFEETILPSQSGTFYFRAKNAMQKNVSFSLSLETTSGAKPFAQTSWDIRLLEKPVEVTKNSTLVDDQKIRIRLEHSANSALISGEKFQILGDSKFLTLQSSTADIVKKGNKILVNGHAADVVRLESKNISDILTISSWERPLEWNKNLHDNAFRGNLEFRIIDDELVVINELLLGDYLKGLAEVSNSAPMEKQKAIAVIARSYAAFYLSSENRKYPNMPYDGDDSPASFQKYRGYGYEKRSKNFADVVEQTANEVVLYDGNLVKTPFFSESDGRTRSAEEVWGWKNTPYLQGVDDSFCKNGKGTKQGHGVGLSGCGAESMANQGFSYKDILKYYYTGISVDVR